MSKLISTAEAAAVLGVTRQCILYRIKNGSIKAELVCDRCRYVMDKSQLGGIRGKANKKTNQRKK